MLVFNLTLFSWDLKPSADSLLTTIAIVIIKYYLLSKEMKARSVKQSFLEVVFSNA